MNANHYDRLAIIKAILIEIIRMAFFSFCLSVFIKNAIFCVMNKMDLTRQEGYVIRVADSFTVDFSDTKHDDEQFAKYIAKFVRKGHVNEDSDHWMNKEIIKNGLK